MQCSNYLQVQQFMRILDILDCLYKIILWIGKQEHTLTGVHGYLGNAAAIVHSLQRGSFVNLYQQRILFLS